MPSTLDAFLCIQLLLTDLYLSLGICLSIKVIFQGALLLPCFLSLPICDAAFVLFSKDTHLDWFSSIFMYKLRFLATVLSYGIFFCPLVLWGLFCSYCLTTQTSFPLLISFLAFHQTDYSKTANQVYLSLVLSNSTWPCACHISHCCINAVNYSTVKIFPPPWRFFVPNSEFLPCWGSCFSLHLFQAALSPFSNFCCCFCRQPVWWEQRITGTENRQQPGFLLQQMFQQRSPVPQQPLILTAFLVFFQWAN